MIDRQSRLSRRGAVETRQVDLQRRIARKQRDGPAHPAQQPACQCENDGEPDESRGEDHQTTLHWVVEERRNRMKVHCTLRSQPLFENPVPYGTACLAIIHGSDYLHKPEAPAKGLRWRFRLVSADYAAT